MKYYILVLLTACISCVQSNKDKQVEKQNKKDLLGTEEVQLIGKSLESMSEIENKMNLKFDFELIEKYVFDLDGDNVKDSICIEKIKDWNDPGDFHKISFITSNDTKQFFNYRGWIRNDAFTMQFTKKIQELNNIDSEFISVIDVGKSNFLVIANGYAFGSDYGNLSVISFSQENPELIYNQNALIREIEDFNQDGVLDISIAQSSEQNPFVETYEVKKKGMVLLKSEE